MSDQLAKLAVVHWALIAGNNAYSFDRMYNELHDADIHNTVAELREIQSHLNDLDLWFQDKRISRLQPRELTDVEIGITACTNSLKRLDDIYRGISTSRRGEPTSRIWGEIRATFKDLEGPPSDRLKAHRVWLTQLFPILKMHFKPQNRTEMNRLHEDIQRVNGGGDAALHAQRMKEWEEYYRQMANMERIARQNQPPSPQYSPTTATAGFVPMAPWAASPTQAGYPQGAYQPTYSQPTYPQRTYPSAGGPPPPGRYGPPIQTQTGFFPGYPSPPISNSSNNSPLAVRNPSQYYYQAPPVRPTTPSRPTTPRPIDEEPYARPISRSSSRSPHRRRPLGEREDYGRSSERRPSTSHEDQERYSRYDYEANRGRPRRPSMSRQGSSSDYFQAESRPKSQCFGRNIDVGNLSHVSEVEVMSLDFDPDMTVYLYRNEETNASRIVCGNSMSGWISDHRGGGGTYQGSIKITALTIRRESSLILTLNRNSKLWARLVFSGFENMVIFFHVFMALRSYSPTPPQESPITIPSGQRWFSGELPLWDARIDYEEDTYRLYLLQDESTKSVRIAAITEGTKHNNMTIWTAFLQTHLTMPHHGLAQESCTIILFQLPVYFFSLTFRPRIIKEFSLKFFNSQDATHFREEIEDLSRRVAY